MTNICRCGTYQRIRAAVHIAATEIAAHAPLKSKPAAKTPAKA
jgi:xanthine dehydrogenase iron-sulfur cluster and FAD-binding subunit A